MGKTDDGKIEVRNINAPDHITRVDRAKYEAMKTALLGVLPADPPGLTAAEAKAALLPHLSPEHFPGGAKSGWWMKCVQLDLEARAVIKRAETKPLRFWRL
ncbi:DUF6958 family protein [Pararhodobacter oceanensis]|uniref:Uncharacterized protein n=1 Tax=Pararhodobacter oceanensis TaxID=2172121 RepID=A0A2T8HWT3_9RHOB|nr:hypothetical protein [Pararhodobacter oceanensis]PVH29889.1 hypothetical protein DDE20_07280 [Pararhodobacter oceanensis]